MRRRDFITLLGGAAAAWPLAAWAQQTAMPVIGFLHGASPEGYAPTVDGFRRGLAQSSYVEGQNVTIEYRWAEGHYDRLPVLAAELVHRQVAGIVTGGTPAALAAKGATSTIPIVINVGIDPVQFGLVASLNRPGGNVTGLAILTAELAAKRLELLHEILPTTTVVALLVNPTTPLTEAETRGARDAARSLGLQLHVLNASTESEIDTAFGTLVELRAGALVVSVDTFINNQRAQIVALAARHAVPAIYGVREFATSGGLMSYGNDLADAYRQSGITDITGLGEKIAEVTGASVANVVPPSFILGSIVKGVVLSLANSIAGYSYKGGHIFSILGLDGPPNSNRRYLILNSAASRNANTLIACQDGFPDDPGPYQASFFKLGGHQRAASQAVHNWREL